jgi:hypothetical protein
MLSPAPLSERAAKRAVIDGVKEVVKFNNQNTVLLSLTVANTEPRGSPSKNGMVNFEPGGTAIVLMHDNRCYGFCPDPESEKDEEEGEEKDTGEEEKKEEEEGEGEEKEKEAEEEEAQKKGLTSTLSSEEEEADPLTTLEHRVLELETKLDPVSTTQERAQEAILTLLTTPKYRVLNGLYFAFRMMDNTAFLAIIVLSIMHQTWAQLTPAQLALFGTIGLELFYDVMHETSKFWFLHRLSLYIGLVLYFVYFALCVNIGPPPEIFVVLTARFVVFVFEEWLDIAIDMEIHNDLLRWTRKDNWGHMASPQCCCCPSRDSGLDFDDKTFAWVPKALVIELELNVISPPVSRQPAAVTGNTLYTEWTNARGSGSSGSSGNTHMSPTAAPIISGCCTCTSGCCAPLRNCCQETKRQPPHTLYWVVLLAIIVCSAIGGIGGALNKCFVGSTCDVSALNGPLFGILWGFLTGSIACGCLWCASKDSVETFLLDLEEKYDVVRSLNKLYRPRPEFYIGSFSGIRIYTSPRLYFAVILRAVCLYFPGWLPKSVFNKRNFRPEYFSTWFRLAYAIPLLLASVPMALLLIICLLLGVLYGVSVALAYCCPCFCRECTKNNQYKMFKAELIQSI